MVLAIKINILLCARGGSWGVRTGVRTGVHKGSERGFVRGSIRGFVRGFVKGFVRGLELKVHCGRRAPKVPSPPFF